MTGDIDGEFPGLFSGRRCPERPVACPERIWRLSPEAPGHYLVSEFVWWFLWHEILVQIDLEIGAGVARPICLDPSG